MILFFKCLSLKIQNRKDLTDTIRVGVSLEQEARVPIGHDRQGHLAGDDMITIGLTQHRPGSGAPLKAMDQATKVKYFSEKKTN